MTGLTGMWSRHTGLTQAWGDAASCRLPNLLTAVTNVSAHTRAGSAGVCTHRVVHLPARTHRTVPSVHLCAHRHTPCSSQHRDLCAIPKPLWSREGIVTSPHPMRPPKLTHHNSNHRPCLQSWFDHWVQPSTEALPCPRHKIHQVLVLKMEVLSITCCRACATCSWEGNSTAT